MNKRNSTTILRTLLLGVAVFVTVIAKANNTSGGEQGPFTALAILILIIIIGAAVFSLLLPFLYKQWFKKNIAAGIIVMILFVLPCLWVVWMMFFE